MFWISLLAVALGGCATTTSGPRPSKVEMALGQKQLDRDSADYYFDSMSRLYSAGRKILAALPEDKAKEPYPVIPILPLNINFDFQKLYSTPSAKGVMVAGILEGWRVEDKDLHRGDEIVSVNGQRVASEKEFNRELKKAQKDHVEIGLQRGVRQWVITAPVQRLRKHLPFVLNSATQKIATHVDQQGFIYTTPALLDFVENDDELAFLLAIQIARVLEKKVLVADLFKAKANLKLGTLFNYYFHGITSDGLITFDTLTGFNFESLGEGDQELIDRQALQYISRAGFDPEKAVQVYERLMIESQRKRELGYGLKVPDEKRLNSINRYVKELKGSTLVEEDAAPASVLSKKSFDHFLDKTIEVTGLGYRILKAVPKKEGNTGIAVLPLLYLNADNNSRKFYSLSENSKVIVAGMLDMEPEKKLQGLARGDELIALESIPILSENDLHEKLQSIHKDSVLIRFRRGRADQELEIPIYRIARKISFSVAKNDASVNAFADPFGGITVTTAMLRFVDNQDQLALVLAHEIAHHLHHHFSKNFGNQMAGAISGISLAFLVETYAPGFGNAAGQMTSQIVAAPYAKKLEQEADYQGLLYLKDAGFDLEKAYLVWRKFAAAIPLSREASITATHPASVERFLLLRKTVEQITGKLIQDDLEDSRDEHELLGPIFESHADPQAAGILETGLTHEMRFVLLGGQARGTSIFDSSIGKVIWYAKFDSSGAFKNYFSRKYRIEWYAPNGALFLSKIFKASYVNEAVAKTALHLKQPLDPKLIGKWRVKVWKKDQLIDDRYFQIVSEKAALT